MNLDSNARRTTLRERLREKLPEILIEAASVVLALMLALALNAWNENRELRERADTARASILAELRANRADLDAARPKLREIVDSLQQKLAKDAPEPHEVNVSMGVTQLSSAAWRAALATDAMRTVDFAWISAIARVYETQDEYLRLQQNVLDQIGSIPADSTLGGKAVAASLVPRFNVLAQIADGLSQSYAETLDGKQP
jgi:cell division protein ZapA (FtsZ GTPase activity inhibitor)